MVQLDQPPGDGQTQSHALLFEQIPLELGIGPDAADFRRVHTASEIRHGNHILIVSDA